MLLFVVRSFKMKKLPFYFIGLTQSEKTFLMSIPKCLGAQIVRFTQVKLTMEPQSNLPDQRVNFKTDRGQTKLFAVQ